MQQYLHIHLILIFLQKRKITASNQQLDGKEDHESLEYKDQDCEWKT